MACKALRISAIAKLAMDDASLSDSTLTTLSVSDPSQASDCSSRWAELIQCNPSLGILLALPDGNARELRSSLRFAVSALVAEKGSQMQGVQCINHTDIKSAVECAFEFFSSASARE